MTSVAVLTHSDCDLLRHCKAWTFALTTEGSAQLASPGSIWYLSAGRIALVITSSRSSSFLYTMPQPVGALRHLQFLVIALVLALSTLTLAQTADSIPPAEISDINFDSAVSQAPVLLMLHAPWCGHCRKFAASYAEIAATLRPDGIIVARADGSTYRVLAQRFGISGFPSFYYINAGKAHKYDAPRSVEGLTRFARSRGEEGGVELTGWTKPMGLYWVGAFKILIAWAELKVVLREKDYSPSWVFAGFAVGLLVLLVIAGCVINCCTAPPKRRQVKKDN